MQAKSKHPFNLRAIDVAILEPFRATEFALVGRAKTIELSAVKMIYEMAMIAYIEPPKRQAGQL